MQAVHRQITGDGAAPVRNGWHSAEPGSSRAAFMRVSAMLEIVGRETGNHCWIVNIAEKIAQRAVFLALASFLSQQIGESSQSPGSVYNSFAGNLPVL